jgi:hypothetical protein
MSRITVLIALLGLALLAGCNQSDGSGSEWICDSYVEGEPKDTTYIEWTCESTEDWKTCQFKFFTETAEETDYFCDEEWASNMANRYACLDQAGNQWGCETEADRENCEVNYFSDPSSVYYCNAAFTVYEDTPGYWACPGLEYPIGTCQTGLPDAGEGFACPRLEPEPECSCNYDALRQECPSGGAGAGCRRALQQCRSEYQRDISEQGDNYAKQVPAGCVFIGAGECEPTWSISGSTDEAAGDPKNYCNPRVGCSEN